MVEINFEETFLPLEEFCFLNVKKPKGITSFDVIFKLRKLLKIKQIGHSGTLDPLAEGVMQIGIGKAARLLDYLPSDKTYVAAVKFGFSSSTLDLEGEIKEETPPKFSFEELQEVLKKFTGEIEQVPPKYSAIKVGGKKLCDLARKQEAKGEEFTIAIPKRKITVYKIKILTPKTAPKEELYANLKLEISCSKGTYIRTLADDIAKALGTRAFLTSLTRTKAGNFEIENSLELEHVSLKSGINPLNALLTKKYELTEEELKKALNGIPPCLLNFEAENGEDVLLTYKNNLVSIAKIEDNKLKIKKVFKKSE